MNEDENIARKISAYTQRKKQAANDAQLLMNRIALLQKEEERARRKIDQTKERAMEIISMRRENERRMQVYIEASTEERALQRELQERNKEVELETRKTVQDQSRRIVEKRREDAHSLNQEKRNLTKQLIREQEKDLRMKQKKRDEVRRLEEEAKRKREEEKRRNDQRVREEYERRAAAEQTEVKRAEKLVKALERKEREWMSKLQDAQTVQEAAFEHLEYALLKPSGAAAEPNSVMSSIRSPDEESNRKSYNGDKRSGSVPRGKKKVSSLR